MCEYACAHTQQGSASMYDSQNNTNGAATMCQRSSCACELRSAEAFLCASVINSSFQRGRRAFTLLYIVSRQYKL